MLYCKVAVYAKDFANNLVSCFYVKTTDVSEIAERHD